jgi:hypothetical protein
MKITDEIDTETTRDFEKKIMIGTLLLVLACLALVVKICLQTKSKTSENRVKISSPYSTNMAVIEFKSDTLLKYPERLLSE